MLVRFCLRFVSLCRWCLMEGGGGGGGEGLEGKTWWKLPSFLFLKLSRNRNEREVYLISRASCCLQQSDYPPPPTLMCHYWRERERKVFPDESGASESSSSYWSLTVKRCNSLMWTLCTVGMAVQNEWILLKNKTKKSSEIHISYSQLAGSFLWLDSIKLNFNDLKLGNDNVFTVSKHM